MEGHGGPRNGTSLSLSLTLVVLHPLIYLVREDGNVSRHRQPAVHRHTLARDGVGRLRREEDARLREVFDGRRLAEGRRSSDVSEDLVRG